MLKKVHIPLYFQFYLLLKEQILSGEIPAGELVGSIEELHQSYGVSHGTARYALQLLAKEGLIIKTQGRRTSVRQQVHPHSWSPQPSRVELSKVMKRQRLRHLFHGWIHAPNRVLAVINAQGDSLKGGQVLRLKFLAINRADEREKSLVEVYVPAWVTEIIPLKALTSRTLESLMISKQFRIARLEQVFRPWYSDSESAELLGLPEGTPVFRRSWTAYLKDRRVFWYSEDTTTLPALNRTIELA